MQEGGDGVVDPDQADVVVDKPDEVDKVEDMEDSSRK